MDRSTKAGQWAENVGVNLTRVSLTGNGVSVGEAKELGDASIKRLNLVVVAVEEGKERSLGTGSALYTTEAKVVASTLEVAEIPEELLEPEGGTLAHSGQLSGLEVGEAEGGEVSVLLSKGSKARDDDGKLGEEEVKTVTEEDEVGVVGNEARGSSETAISITSMSMLTG